jgi:uncharacterized protein (TIGR02996 family)
MSDEDALLEAIAAHPAEDTPRLVYADWLDEHGRHARAEFVRVQIAIAQKEHLPRAALNEYVDLYKRNQELIDNHRAELLGPLAALPPDAEVQFHRGFAEEVTLSGTTTLWLAGPFAAVRPMPRVVLVDEVTAARRRLAYQDGAINEKIRQVVSAIRTKPGSEDHAAWYTESRVRPPEPGGWPRLAELDLSGCRMGDRLCAAVLRADLLPLVADLDLSVNELTDAAIDSLLASGLPRQLKRLILGGNPLSDDAAIALASRWPTGEGDRLEHLNLRFTTIGAAGQAALLRRFGGRVDLF